VNQGKRKIPTFFHVPKNAGTYYISMMLLFFRWWRRKNRVDWMEMQPENENGEKKESIKNIEIYDDKDDTLILARILIGDPTHIVEKCPEIFDLQSRGKATYLKTTISKFSKFNLNEVFLFTIVIEADGFIVSEDILEDVFGRINYTFVNHLILRNPYARARSFFNYITSNKSKHERTHGKILSSTFEEYLASSFVEDSWIIRVMCGLSDDEYIEEFHAEFTKDLLSEFKVYDISKTDQLLNDVFKECYGISFSELPESWSSDIVKNTSSKPGKKLIDINELDEKARELFFERTKHDYSVYEQSTS